ncbi:MAG TPA: hypothetical protein DCM40_16035 [Maribacter sp.]|nr:hypothetical protein [Maribacter sp.]
MKLELKNIKYFASGSQETPCYTATLYIDGKKAVYVDNNGHGGCDRHHAVEPFTWKDVEEVKSYLAKQSGDSFEPLDTWCQDKMYDHVEQKKLKRDMNTKYICVDYDKNQLYAYPKKVANATVFQKHMEKKHPKDTCLNFLPFDVAWHIFEGVTA